MLTFSVDMNWGLKLSQSVKEKKKIKFKTPTPFYLQQAKNPNLTTWQLQQLSKSELERQKEKFWTGAENVNWLFPIKEIKFGPGQELRSVPVVGMPTNYKTSSNLT